jgi:hypothetical protein
MGGVHDTLPSPALGFNLMIIRGKEIKNEDEHPNLHPIFEFC